MTLNNCDIMIANSVLGMTMWDLVIPINYYSRYSNYINN